MDANLIKITIAFAITIECILLITKIYVFAKCAHTFTIRRWLFFTPDEIIEADSPHARQLKKLNNTLSLFLLYMVIITFLTLDIVRS